MRANRIIEQPIIGLALKDLKGNVITGTNTTFEGNALEPMAAGGVRSVVFEMVFPELAPGSYALSPAVANGSQTDHAMLHWVDDAAILQVVNDRHVMGMMRFQVNMGHPACVTREELQAAP